MFKSQSQKFEVKYSANLNFYFFILVNHDLRNSELSFLNKINPFDSLFCGGIVLVIYIVMK